MSELVHLAARGSAGLLVGVYAAFAVGVMPALRQVEDRTFVEVMQRVNVSIVNPVFVPVFLGAPALALWVALLERTPLTWTAAGLGSVTLLISVAGNIPLNDQLERTSLEGAVDAARARFENRWTVLNAARTVTGLASLVCLLRATVSP